MTISVVFGGAKSGKSTFAEKLATRISGDNNVLYVATAEARDEEMKKRIAHHRATRPQGWTTLEEACNLHQALTSLFNKGKTFDVILIDCITVWLSNLLIGETEEDTEDTSRTNGLHDDQQDAIIERVESLCDLLQANDGQEAILVANEVGGGLVPPYPLGRIYRDLAGMVNQLLARRADRVYLVMAGIPLDLRKLQAKIEDFD